MEGSSVNIPVVAASVPAEAKQSRASGGARRVSARESPSHRPLYTQNDTDSHGPAAAVPDLPPVVHLGPGIRGYENAVRQGQ